MAKARAHTLIEIAAASGISRKTVQKALAQPGSPTRTGDLKSLVAWVKKAAPGGSKLPDDLAERAILIKFETLEHRPDEKREAAEKLRLWNLEKKGQLIEVKAQSAAIGQLLSSTISKW